MAPAVAAAYVSGQATGAGGAGPGDRDPGIGGHRAGDPGLACFGAAPAGATHPSAAVPRGGLQAPLGPAGLGLVAFVLRGRSLSASEGPTSGLHAARGSSRPGAFPVLPAAGPVGGRVGRGPAGWPWARSTSS